MKRLAQWPFSRRSLVFGLFGFIVAFSFEIRVKAEVAELPNAAKVQEQPDQCLNSTKTCALRTENGEKFVFELDKAVTVYMDQDTAVVRLSSKEIRLVQGTVWVQADAPFTVKSEFGDAHIEKGDFWVSRHGRQILISATGPKTTADVELHPRGSQEVVAIEPGMENWLGSVGVDGKAEVGLPTAIEFHKHLERWARLYPDKRASFEKEVEKFRTLWREASVHAAEVHQALYERKVASVEAAETRKAEERHKAESHDRTLREMFRKRVLNGE